MNPEAFLFMSFITDGYYFMESVKKEFDFQRSMGFPGTDLVYDRQKKSVFEYKVYNRDYSDKRTVDMKSSIVSDEIVFWQCLDAYRIIEDFGKGKLKGKLKEIAAKLDDEYNAVLMLVKHKR